MLDHFHIPTPYGQAEVFYFEGTSRASGEMWIPWTKPRGKSMMFLLLVGKGGNGGNGVIGANSTAAGGGGGGSGSQIRLMIPLHSLPNTIYLCLAGTTSSVIPSTISMQPNLTTANILAVANGGGNGGNASGATAGAAGTAGGAFSAGNLPAGAAYFINLAGQVGTAGGTTGNGNSLTYPTSGILVTGGCGGAGLGTNVVGGSVGGGIITAGSFPNIDGGMGGPISNFPPVNGMNGFRPVPGLMFGCGGAGGGSTHGAATGAGLVQASGGHGAPGCGGGGSGGALTGSTPGTSGLGGPSFCSITVW